MLSKLARYLLRNNENFKKLDVMLSKPEDWIFDGFRIRHKKVRLALWVCNGVSFFYIDIPSVIKLGFLMRFALWSKAEKLMTEKDELTELLKSIELEKNK